MDFSNFSLGKIFEKETWILPRRTERQLILIISPLILFLDALKVSKIPAARSFSSNFSSFLIKLAHS